MMLTAQGGGYGEALRVGRIVAMGAGIQGSPDHPFNAAPALGPWVDEFEVLAPGQLRQSAGRLCPIRRVAVAATDLDRNRGVVGPMDEMNRDPSREPEGRASATVSVGDFRLGATEKRPDDPAAQLKLVTQPQIDGAGQRNNAGQCHSVELLCCAQGSQVPTCRKPDDDDSPKVERKLVGEMREEFNAENDVVERSGEAAARLASASVFDVPGGEAILGECRAQMRVALQVVFGAPPAAVDADNNRPRPLTSGNPEFPKLVRIVSVETPCVTGGNGQ